MKKRQALKITKGHDSWFNLIDCTGVKGRFWWRFVAAVKALKKRRLI